MVLVIAVVGWLLLLVALCFILKDFSRFIFKKSFGLKMPTQFVDYGEYAGTWTGVFVIALFGFFFYKLGTALVAYTLSTDLISFFRLMRGVYAINNEGQNPFLIKHLLSGLILLPLLQFVTCYIIYRGIRSFMNRINHSYGASSYSESDVLYYGFFGTLFFIAFEILSYSQNIPRVSGVAHLIYLSVAKLGLVCYFFAISNLHLLRNETYRKSLPQYVSLSRIAKHIVYQPAWTIVFTLIIGIALSVPLYFGTQFLENNWLVILCFALSGYLLFQVIKNFVATGYNYFGAIMFFDAEVSLIQDINWLRYNWGKKPLMILGGLAVVLLLVKAKLFFFLLFFVMILVLVLVIFHLLNYSSGLGLSLILAAALNHESPTVNSRKLKRYLFTSAIGFGRAITPTLLLGLMVFLVLSYAPKKYEFSQDNNYVTSVVDGNNYPLLIGISDYNACTPVSPESLPPFLSKCLLLQEDRNFQEQRSWLPKWSNWHGVSMASFYRLASGTGGGSNINMQLIKNEAFVQSFPQDFQRKFTEVLSAYQLSLQLTPEEIVTQYFNKVGMIGGSGQSGVAMASFTAFNRPINQLNELEMLYLINSLKRSSHFKTTDGYISYSVAPDHAWEVKESLIAQAEYWHKKDLLSTKTLKILKNQQLRFSQQPFNLKAKTTTKEFIKKQLSPDEWPGATYQSTLSAENQIRMAKAVGQFERKFFKMKRKEEHELYSAALVLDIETGYILGHHGGHGVTDLTTFAGGSPMGSIIKPFILLELLESGFSPNEIKLYDGKIKGTLTPNNYSRRYSNQKIGINEILGKSLNAPMVNIRQVTDAVPLYQQVEMKFANIGINEDAFLNLEEPVKKNEHEINYPLGSRNMTLFDIGQAYQTLFNNGSYRELSIFTGKYDPYDNIYTDTRNKAGQIFDSENIMIIKNALNHTMKPGGTGTHISHLLPHEQKFYAKTGTSDQAKHGYTILCDDDILIVSFVTYGKVTGNHLELNDTPPIPYESGVRSAGILAAYIYQEWNTNEVGRQVALK